MGDQYVARPMPKQDNTKTEENVDIIHSPGEIRTQDNGFQQVEDELLTGNDG
jgi:hypothetical protein